MAPTSAHLPTVADHIANFLLAPDILFLQEIQDNSGPTDDGVVIANVTLSTLAKAIADISNVTYDFVEIAPVDGQDGGQPGGNIRQAYLYRPEKLSLVPGSLAGEALDSVEVVSDYSGKVSLRLVSEHSHFLHILMMLSPVSTLVALIPPILHGQTQENPWLHNGKLPLAAFCLQSMYISLRKVVVLLRKETLVLQSTCPWIPVPCKWHWLLYVLISWDCIGVKLTDLLQDFVKSVFSADSEANVIIGGDFNEFSQTRSVFASLNGIMTEIDEVAGIPPVERYTYVFDQNTEQLDHIFISPAIANRTLAFEHIHVSIPFTNWFLVLTIYSFFR